MPINNIRSEGGFLIIERGTRRIAKIPEAFVLDTIGIDLSSLPIYQRMVMQAKHVIESFSELTASSEGVRDLPNSTLWTQKREAAATWLMNESEVRGRKKNKLQPRKK
jgi:hypothetical protein